MKIQIIGQVTGLPRKEVTEKFERAETKLKAKGYEVINPVKLVPETTSWEEAMKMCLKSLLEVDAYLILPCWVNSRGAQVEYMVASSIQLTEVRL